MDIEMVGIAAEFAVASELARRDVYAQPTFGHLKRTDLLATAKDGRPIKIEAKGKQGKSWPNCKGIADSRSILVLVDFCGKHETERPDYYVLTAKDWRAFVEDEILKRPHKKIAIDPDNVPEWTTQVKKGKPYRGMGVDSKQVSRHKEAWHKVRKAIGCGC